MINALIYLAAISGATITILVVYFRHNPLFVRVINIFSGTDSSTKGRTAEAYYLARRLLDEKNEFWGIGVGQVKLLGYDVIKSHYLYYGDFVATIPNVMAETLAIFGWFGFFLKIFIEILLFFFTRVWTNYYRLLLFIFIFVFQFAGSFITNLAEYVIWILAFTNVFHQFDVKNYRRPERELSISSS